MITLEEKWGNEFAKTLAEPIVKEFKEVAPKTRLPSLHEAHPVALSILLTDKFGYDWLDWETNTLKKEILETCGATVSEHNWQKIQAVRTILKTTGFWSEWHIFEKVVQALNNNLPSFNITQRCTIPQLVVGVEIANHIRPEVFGNEIKQYIAACAIDSGVQYLPPPLDFAQLTLAQPSYLCNDCGQMDSDDNGDSRCDFCIGRYQDATPLNNKPAVGISSTVGVNITKFYKRDYNQVAGKLTLALQDPNYKDFDDTKSEDVQVIKLLVALDYAKTRREELVTQLRELKICMMN